MAAHRRPLVTSAVAGGLLCALWFVPTAKATHETEPQASPPPAATTTQSDVSGQDVSGQDAAGQTADAQNAEPEAASRAAGPRLADTGSFDTTPYVTGGIAFLGVGAGLMVHATRRSRTVAL
ncbi:hypothetical protein QNO07_04385 [Streptomyces sp. 549]|uniref:hypothetical protein n=1 Tax=Streptomyces sp. 549 TaxID=3049076 RepID=UPI0024C20EEA|nr:hypothetical protein [Streptomyces sp. 549]MDK1472669.1 hypothetical protein [Streptomyces sp. 549]